VFASLRARYAEKIIAQYLDAARYSTATLRFFAKLESPHGTGTSEHAFGFSATRLCVI